MALHQCRHVPIPPAAATAILVAGVVTTAVPLHTDVFEDSNGGKVTTAPLHHLHKRHVLRFCHPLSVYLPPPLYPPLHVESPQHLRFEKDTGSRRIKVPRGLYG